MRYSVNNSYEKRCVLTQQTSSVMPRRMGRKKQWAEDMQARFPQGTFERIAAVLGDGEDRTDFVRGAVDRELKRREKQPASDTRQGLIIGRKGAGDDQ